MCTAVPNRQPHVQKTTQEQLISVVWILEHQMAAPSRKISAASARSHTRRKQHSKGFSLPSGILKKLFGLLLVGLIAWAYQAIQPPPPRIPGSPNGPPITSSRIKLKDGRHLSYIEMGVPKEKAKYKFISIHAFDNCKYDVLPISPEMFDKFSIYLLSFDRAGYGESDPNPNTSVKSTTQDIEELADQLGLGPKFFVIGISMGASYVWGSLKYIPNRLAGAALIAPASNYWWPGFPAKISQEAFAHHPVSDQWAFRVAHYAPWLTYWWNSQKWFPGATVINSPIELFSARDKELLSKISGREQYEGQIRQQGVFECLHRDLNIILGSWEFDPLDLDNVFPNSKGSIHIWHGMEDPIVNVTVSRYISQKLPWVHYHELPGEGHLLQLVDGFGDKVLEELLFGEH